MSLVQELLLWALFAFTGGCALAVLAVTAWMVLEMWRSRR